MFAFDNDKRRDRPTSCIDVLDYCCPFAIARLLRLYLATPFGTHNNHCNRDNAHLKPSLVEIVDISFLDVIFRDCVPYKRKPTTNNLGIFALGPLIVVFPIKTYGEL
jgi:hypothetical protein